MRIAIFGSGGVGGYFGGRLAQAGEEVIFIARGAHLQAIREHGLKVESIQGDFSIQPAQAYADTEMKKVGVVDVVLVAVKTWQVGAAAEAMRPLVEERTIIIPLENGIEAPDQLAAVLGAQHILGGVCQISSYLAAPGVIRHVSIEPSIAFGELDGRANTRSEALHQAFLRAGVRAEQSADIRAAMWYKFLFIAPISGLGALTRSPLGEYRSLPETRGLLEAAMYEIVAVAHALGVNLPAEAVAQRLAFIDNVAPVTMASMTRDILEGRPSELEAQNGAVVRLGRQTGVPTPVNAFIYAALLPQERRARNSTATQ